MNFFYLNSTFADCFKQFKAQVSQEFSQIKLENKEQAEEIKFLQSEIKQYRSDLNVTNEKLKKITTAASTKKDKESTYEASKENNVYATQKSKRPARLLPLSLLR